MVGTRAGRAWRTGCKYSPVHVSQTDHPALENVNFALKPGQMLVFAGRLVPAKVPCCRSFSVIRRQRGGYPLS